MELKKASTPSMDLPYDWSVKTIRSVADRVTVGFVGSMSHLFQSSGVPLLRGQNIRSNRLHLDNLKFISNNTHNLWKKSALYENDIAIVRVGYPGTSCVIPRDLGEANAASLIVITPNKNVVNSSYICYYLNSVNGRNQIENLLVGGAQQVINIATAALCVIPLPPTLREQQSIAEALSDADAYIESIEQLLAKKRDIKQGVMQELLTGRRRLPGFQQSQNFKNSEFGPLPEDWDVRLLGDVTYCLDNLRVPLNFSERSRISGNYPYCGANGVLDYVNDYRVDDSVILIAEDGGYFDEFATRPIAYQMSGKFWVNNHAHILKAKPGVDQTFVFYTLVHKNILPFLANGTRAKLNKSEMNKITIITPSQIGEQASIALALSDMDDEIHAVEAILDKARDIKQGMMQNLLTGKVRLV